MSVVSFPGYYPPPRYDGEPWTHARLEESVTEGGSYLETETFELDPVDTDPVIPAARSFTTSLGTVGVWYRFVWVDEDLGESTATAPGQNTAGVVPAAITSPVDAAELATIIQVNATSNADSLNRVLAAAYGEIVSETGRNDFAGWELDLVEQVNLARAEELWRQMKAPWGLIGLDSEIGPTRIARDTFERHAHALAPLKRQWGIAQTMAFPTTTVLDDFDRANGALGANWTADIRAQGHNMPRIVGNQVTHNALGISNAWWNPDTFGPDSEAQIAVVDWTGSTHQKGVYLHLRITEPGTANHDGYQCEFTADTTSATHDVCVISRWNNGSQTFLVFPAVTNYQDGDELGFEAVGDVLTAYRKRAGTWSVLVTHTDTSPLTGGGYIGVHFSDDSSTYDNFGGGTVGGAVPDTEPPTDPADLVADTFSSSRIDLDWTASTDNIAVTNYRVERCTGIDCVDFAEIATSATASYNNTGLAAEQMYRYRVRAADAAGNLSGYTDVAEAVTEPASTAFTLRGLMDEMADTLLAVVGPETADTEVQVTGRMNPNPTPPSIDIYPGDPFRDNGTAGFGDGGGELLFTVRARVTTVDNVAGQNLLLRLMDDQDDISVAGTLMEDQTLNGLASSVYVEGNTGYTRYLDGGTESGGLLGCEWRVRVLRVHS